METDYWHSLDNNAPLRKFNIRDIGMSAIPTKKGLDQLKASVFQGASTVELGFVGKEKGNLGQGGTTPEMHSRQEREEIRQLAKINEIDVSTHATVAIGGIAGFGERGFEPVLKEKAVQEIQRTIDFAADVAGGGPVVVHTGEFPRPIIAAGKEFKAHPGEETRRVHHLVDSFTGDVIKTVRADEVIYEPVPKIENGEIVYQLDKEGNIKKDDFTKQPIPEAALDEHGDIEVKAVSFSDFKLRLKEMGKSEKDIEKDAPLWFFQKQQAAEIEHAAGQAEQYEGSFKEGLRRREELKKLREQFHRAPTPEIKQLVLRDAVRYVREEPGEDKEKFFNEAIREADKMVTYGREIAISSRMNAKKLATTMGRAKSLEDYGVEQSADALARSAIYAYDKEKAMKLKKALFVAPENIFPEQFGAHPQELKKLVLKSREVMAKSLQVDRGISKSEANKIADNHIKATFDVGHANTWKKYFQRNPGESLKQSDKRFKKWMGKQVEDLQKSGVIGHVHLSDNFGYYDEHLSPGDGNTPIKELAEKLEKHGYKGKFIVEAGGQPEGKGFTGWTSALGLASPVYKIDTAGTSWSDVEGSYFGRTSGPNYLVGDYAPSKDWTLWSETQLE